MSQEQLPSQGALLPWTFLEGHINEPLVFTRDAEDRMHCLSNVCTHRGNILVENACESSGIRCRYHGRRFSPTGEFISAPGFEEAEDFPSVNENLPHAKSASWGNFQFVAIEPAFDFSELTKDMNRRLHWLPFDKMKSRPEFNRDYYVDANWALYVDNYLEGLHVPFVHPALATLLDTKDYRNEVHSYSNLQIGLAANHKNTFSLPDDSPEAGDPVAAYYYFLFPNMAFNFYPWGVSINIVIPIAVDKTCIRYLTYVFDEAQLANYSPKMIEQTEYEDEAVVNQVQKGHSIENVQTRALFTELGSESTPLSQITDRIFDGIAASQAVPLKTITY